MGPFKRVAWLMLIASLSGCVAAGSRSKSDSMFVDSPPFVTSKVFVEAPPVPEDHPVQVYRLKLPNCDFEELGTVVATSGTAAHPSVEDLKKRARELGGDALAGLDAFHIPYWDFGTRVVEGMSATVIRFVDPDCRD